MSESELLESITQENLTLEVTTRCTSACMHCFARAGRAEFIDMAREIASGIIDEGFACGYRHLHLTGGEPLVWEALFPVLEHAFTRGYESAFINTNGMLLSRDICRELASFKAVSLSISIQGPEGLHDRIRGEDSYRKAIAGLEEALGCGLAVSVFSSTGRSLLAGLPRFAESLFSGFPGIDRLTLIQLIRVPGDALDLSGELLTPGEFVSLVRTAALLNLYGYRISIQENPLARAVAVILGMPWVPAAPSLHRAGRLVVMADLSLTLAHSTREPVGAYRPGSLAETLASAEYRERTRPDNFICPRCKFFSCCRSEGMLRPSEQFRDMEEHTPFCVRVLGEAQGAQNV